MPTTRSQAAGKTNGAHMEGHKEGVKRRSSAKHKGGKRAKIGEGEDVSSAKVEKEPVGDEKEEKQETEKKVDTDEGVKLTAENGEKEVEENDKEKYNGNAKQNGAEKAEEDGTETEEQPAKDSVSKAKGAQMESEPEGFEKGSGVLERGHVYFFYRPKVEIEEAASLEDVSKFSILLLPREPDSDTSAGTPEEKKNPSRKRYRFITVGKKRLPDPSKKHEVFWAAVVGYGDNLRELTDDLGPKEYETKTRGERHIAEARLAGRGNYIIYARTTGPPSKHATYLAYQLSHPQEQGEVQKALDIFPSSSFVLQVKNPTVSAPPQAGLNPRERAQYPEEVIEAEFGGEGDGKGLRFIPANPVKLLDFKGAEILLIADKKDIAEVVGEAAAEQVEESAEEEGKELSEQMVMKELMMDVEKFTAEPLEGMWA